MIAAHSYSTKALDELGLKVGQEGYAIIKTSDVMVGLDG
jgi:molybdopterin-binding protein